VLAWVTRETGRDVIFTDAAVHARVGNERIAGELRVTPLEAVEIVPRLYGVVARVDGGTVLLETPNAP
jgi:hypothetical protein